MDDHQAFRNDISENMQMKDTAELLDIWRKNDRRAWTPEAMNIVGQILVQRLGTVPPQEAPAEDVSIGPDASRLLWIASAAGALSWISVIFTILLCIGLMLGSLSPSLSNQTSGIVFLFLIIILTGGGFFLTMQFVAKGIPVLLDLQDKTDRLIELLEEDSEAAESEDYP